MDSGIPSRANGHHAIDGPDPARSASPAGKNANYNGFPLMSMKKPGSMPA
jgi:hypothetical protein